MARTSYVPEKEKPEPRFGKGDADFRHMENPELPPELEEEPEFASVEDFVQFMMDSDRDTFTTSELVKLHLYTGIYNTTLRIMLEGYGLNLKGVTPQRDVRTFSSNPHDRWYGPGSSPTHGGGGGDQITGIAGRAG